MHLFKASIPIRKKHHLYLLIRNLLVRVQMPSPCLGWRKNRDSVCPGSSRGGQPNMFCSCLKHRKRKKNIFMTKKTDSVITSQKTLSRVWLWSLYILHSFYQCSSSSLTPIFCFCSQLMKTLDESFQPKSVWLLSTPFHILTKRLGISFPLKNLWTVLPFHFFLPLHQ